MLFAPAGIVPPKSMISERSGLGFPGGAWLAIAWLVQRLRPAFFQMELRCLKYLGNATSLEEFRAELQAYHSEHRRHGGFFRNGLSVRLSGRRLMSLVEEVMQEAAD